MCVGSQPPAVVLHIIALQSVKIIFSKISSKHFVDLNLRVNGEWMD